MPLRKIVPAAWIIAAPIPSSAFGQAGRSTIAGVVNDATGGAQPRHFPGLRTGAGASVVIDDPATYSRSTTT
jgi:hypothetical protein